MTTTPEKETILGGKVAVTLGAVLLVGFGGLAWLTSLDRSERKQLEALQSPSAAGEPSITIPSGAEPGKDSAPVLTLSGVLYYGEDIVTHSDGTMMKAFSDDSGKITVYQRIRRNKLQPELFVKLGPGRFMEIGKREEKPKSAEPKPQETPTQAIDSATEEEPPAATGGE